MDGSSNGNLQRRLLLRSTWTQRDIWVLLRRRIFELLGLAGLLLIGGCGVEAQQMPEPHETKRVEEVVSALGVQRTYDSRTLLPNPTPDGLVLMHWIERRRATLNRALPLTLLPALINPGTVGATLEWEREAARAESGVGDAVVEYMLDYEMRRGRCERNAREEAEWYERERQAHAKGLRRTLIDWQTVNRNFEARCNEEARVHATRAAAEQQASEATEAQLRRDEQACRRPWEQANSVYIEALTEETERELAAASEAMEACIQGLERRYGRTLGR